MKNWSLATRIVSGVLCVITLSLLALSIAVAGFTRYEITERLDNSLQEVSERLQAIITIQPHKAQSDNVAWVPDVGPRTLAYQVVDQSGHVVLRSQNAPVEPFVPDIHTGLLIRLCLGFILQHLQPRLIVFWLGNPRCIGEGPHGAQRLWPFCRY